jgi:predicted metal-binding membrane protein
MVSERASQQVFFGTSALLFIASAALTLALCSSMSAMGAMPMSGGWTMSMTWMRTPGQTWAAAAASFLTMWVVMMATMMLPSLVPMLWRYRQAVGSAGELRLASLTALAGLAYFLVWTFFGLAVYPLGAAVAAVVMDFPAMARVVPIAIGAIVLLAGAFQFTPWKSHSLACCRKMPGHDLILPADAGTAWQQGLHFGVHCCLSCTNLTLILLVTGMMDLKAMAVVTAAITAERLAPAGKRVAQAIGAVAVSTGLLLIVRAAGPNSHNWISLAIVVIFPTLAILYRIHVEEAALIGAFGEQYIEYMKTTKRLVSGVYSASCAVQSIYASGQIRAVSYTGSTQHRHRCL